MQAFQVKTAINVYFFNLPFICGLIHAYARTLLRRQMASCFLTKYSSILTIGTRVLSTPANRCQPTPLLLLLLFSYIPAAYFGFRFFRISWVLRRPFRQQTITELHCWKTMFLFLRFFTSNPVSCTIIISITHDVLHNTNFLQCK